MFSVTDDFTVLYKGRVVATLSRDIVPSLREEVTRALGDVLGEDDIEVRVDEAYNEGLDEGRATYKEAYDDGFEDGRTKGRREGYDEGLTEAREERAAV
jgi:flagellar biosynthesis/type III secretory pathway protein FliH